MIEISDALSQLPCWRHLSPEVYQELIAGLVTEFDADAAAERKLTGRKPLGVKAILRAHPHTEPDKTKKSPAPRFHAASKAAREGFRKAYGLFLAAFREAAERLKAGDRMAKFPNGCFPPPAVRQCVSGRTAAGGEWRRRTTLLVDSSGLDDSRKGEVGSQVEEKLQAARREASFGPIQHERLAKRPLGRP
jgi:hypothetical protein